MEGQRSLIVSALNMKEAEILTISPKEPGAPFSTYAYIKTPLLMACFLQTLPSQISIHVFVQILPSLSFQIIFLWAIYIRPIPSPPSLNFLSFCSDFQATVQIFYYIPCLRHYFVTVFLLNVSGCFWRHWSLISQLIIESLSLLILMSTKTQIPMCQNVQNLQLASQAQLSNSAEISVDVAPPFRVAMMPCFPSSAALCFD